MNISYYTAISAMNAFQSELDVTANNMANVSTPGYKVLRSSFDDLLYTQMDTNADQVGHGGKPTARRPCLTRESSKTGQDLDFAILGNAFRGGTRMKTRRSHIIHKETGRFRYRPQTKETISRHGTAMCSAVTETHRAGIQDGGRQQWKKQSTNERWI